MPVSPDSISVLIADDHCLLRNGLKISVEQALPGSRVFEAADCAQAIQLIKEQPCHLIFLDFLMPPGNSLDCCRQLRNLCPQAKIIGISINNQSDTALQMINAGAHGFLSKNAFPSEIKEAIDQIFSGKTFITKNLEDNLASILINRQKSKPVLPHWVTDRIIDILKGIDSGKTSRQIAEECFTSRDTIDRDRGIIIRNIGSRHVAQMIKFAKEHGIIE